MTREKLQNTYALDNEELYLMKCFLVCVLPNLYSYSSLMLNVKRANFYQSYPLMLKHNWYKFSNVSLSCVFYT